MWNKKNEIKIKWQIKRANRRRAVEVRKNMPKTAKLYGKIIRVVEAVEAGNQSNWQRKLKV